MLKIHFSQNDMRNMMLIQQTLIQYLLQKKNLCEIFKVPTIWGNINLFIRPQHLGIPHIAQGIFKEESDGCRVNVDCGSLF